MKKFVFVIFLVGFCNVFASFEFDILGQLTASTGITIAPASGNSITPSIKGTTSAIFGASLQIGNQYSINKRLTQDKPMEAPIMNSMSIENQNSPKELKAVSVLLDIKIEQETIAIVENGGLDLTTTQNANKNMYKMSGLNLGAGITTKFIIGKVNSLVPRDTILGFGVGAKVLVNLIGVKATILGIPPIITPYIDFIAEQRFFVARKFALVGGINIGVDIMLPNHDLVNLFDKLGLMKVYPSFNIGVSLGMHFGN